MNREEDGKEIRFASDRAGGRCSEMISRNGDIGGIYRVFDDFNLG